MIKYNSLFRYNIINNLILTFIYYLYQNLTDLYYRFLENNEIEVLICKKSNTSVG